MKISKQVLGVALVSSLLAGSLGAATGVTIKAVLENKKVNVNGEESVQKAIVYDNTTYLPLREVGKLMDAEVAYKDGVVYVNNNGTVGPQEEGAGITKKNKNMQFSIEKAEVVPIYEYGEGNGICVNVKIKNFTDKEIKPTDYFKVEVTQKGFGTLKPTGTSFAGNYKNSCEYDPAEDVYVWRQAFNNTGLYTNTIKGLTPVTVKLTDLKTGEVVTKTLEVE